MNKMLILATIAAALCGCVSEELTWGGQKAVRQPDGTVIVDAATGRPYYEKDQNHLERFSHLNDVEFKDFHVAADGEHYEASVGTFYSATGSNTIGVINASLSGATKLVAECGALYTKIAGGATVDVISAAVGKAIAFFKSQGGNPEKATASLDGDKLKITDGQTCIECDAAGNCTSGNCADR